MMKNLVNLSLIALGWLLVACQPSSSTKASAPSAKAATHAPTSQTGSSSGLGSLNSLFSGLGGGTSTLTSTNSASTGQSSSDTVQWSARFGDPFLSFQIYDPLQNYLSEADVQAAKNPATTSDTYDCPGDSFLLGFRGAYDLTTGDRQMQPYCQFFEDQNGEPLKKKNCQNYTAITAGTANSKPFLCPTGQLVGGFQSTWDSSKADRSYAFECCQAVTESNASVDFASQTDTTTNQMLPECESIVSQANPLLGSLDQHCVGSMTDQSTGQTVTIPSVIYSISNSYMQHQTPDGTNQNDREWSFQCCALAPSN